MDAIDSTLIYQYAAPTSTSHRPKESSKPILTPAYELRLCLVAMVQNQSFSRMVDENPYLHLQEFEQTYDYLRIEGMFDETLRWKLFPFFLKGRAKKWYNRTVEKKHGDWGTLCSSFCLDFFPISKVVNLRTEVLSFKQEDNESLTTSWEYFNSLIDSGPDLAL
jgi:hypothetical protein